MRKATELPKSIPELHNMIFALQEENEVMVNALRDEIALLKHKYQLMLEQFRLAKLRKFSSSSESNVLQYELQFDEAEAVPIGAIAEEENTITVSYTRTKPKRRSLPDDLPREVIEHDITELDIDNNGAENQIRPFPLGRKNWLFSGSPRGAHASALFYSLIATAVANGWNPYDYLLHLFKNIRDCKTSGDYNNLMPFNIASKAS